MDVREYFSRPEEELVAESIAGGMDEATAKVFIRSFQNALGVQSAAEAHRGGAGAWEREQAPWDDPNNPDTDPSPDSLDPNVPLDLPE